MSWIQRNWKWLVPTAAVLFFGLFTALFLSVVGILKSSEPYVLALEMVRQDTRVAGVLGTPIEDGFMPEGSVRTSGVGGSAELAISVSGPRGDGVVYLTASRSMGEWSVDVLVLQTDSGRIDLLKETGIP